MGAGRRFRHTGGDLKQSLARISARVHVIAFERDMFIPPHDCAAEQALIRRSELKIVPTPCGHFGLMGLLERDRQFIDDLPRTLLDMPE
jgi:homoserine O-acetyltransferase/O-succinyltransferase